MKNKIKAAGGIVIQGKKILFIKKNGRWEFPKGRLKKGSKRKNTALREIYEETGIPQENLNIIKPLIPTHDNIKDGKDVVIKKTYWYLVEHFFYICTTACPRSNFAKVKGYILETKLF